MKNTVSLYIELQHGSVLDLCDERRDLKKSDMKQNE